MCDLIVVNFTETFNQLENCEQNDTAPKSYKNEEEMRIWLIRCFSEVSHREAIY